MHFSLTPTHEDLSDKKPEPQEVTGFAHVLKFNPNHSAEDGRFTSGPGSAAATHTPAEGRVSIKPAFNKRTKLTIQQVTEALHKQGMKLEPIGTKQFQAYYRVSDKHGNALEISGKDLGKTLTQKFNPYHGEDGKFTNATGATFVKIGPQYEKTHAKSRQRLADAKKIAPEKVAHAKSVEPRITADMQSVKGKGEFVGLEYAVKGEGSMTRKIFSDAEEKKKSAADAAKEIGDAVRYTLQLHEDDYAEGAINALKALEAKGYKVYKFKNTWKPGSEYQGLNTNLEAPDGTKIELQFHTAASWHTKEKLNHPLYEKTREPGVPKAVKEKLKKQMISNWSDVPVPKNVYDMKWPPGNPG